MWKGFHLSEFGQSQELHEYGMKNGHPPIADKLLLIDFDGTIVPWGPLMGDKEPEPDCVEVLQAFRAAGFRIGIFTSRMSKTWAESVVQPDVGDYAEVVAFLNQQERYIAKLLNQHDIPWDFITAEKMPAQYYIDDKAIRYESGLWNQIRDIIL